MASSEKNKSKPPAAHRRKSRQRDGGKGALQILEEAFHLLRVCSGSALFRYYVGAIPFAAISIYFVTDMANSSYASRDAAGAALLMVIAYFWMRIQQAQFCVRLWERINPGQLPRRSVWQRFRYQAALCLMQAFAYPVLLASVCFMVPLPWAIATWQNSCVLALTQEYGKSPLRGLLRQSLRCSHYEWTQNFGILAILSFLFLLMWVNVLSTCIIVPTFAQSFFGFDSIFSENLSAAIGNSTFFFGTFLLNWLALSPLLKAASVIRCFYASSKTTGDDLLSRLASARRSREIRQQTERRGAALVGGPGVGKTLLLCLVGLAVATASASPLLWAQETTGTAETQRDSSRVIALEKAISETMEQKQFQWRLSRLDLEAEEGEESWFSQKLTEIAKGVNKLFKDLIKMLEEAWDKMMNRENPRVNESDKSIFDSLRGLSNMFSIILIAIVAGLLAWLIYILVKQYRTPTIKTGDDDVLLGEIDLESEEIVASDLPEDEWLRLAREQIARGESRLAVRALFLASLAHLGERGFLKIARFKSNRDYHRELELRARQEKNLRAAFAENTGIFERTWYGLHHIGEEVVNHFLSNHEQITASADHATGAAGEIATT